MLKKNRTGNFDHFVESILKQNKTDTLKMMSNIIDFFNDKHLSILGTNSVDSTDYSNTLQNEIQYLQSAKNLKEYEGFWKNESNLYVIAIVRKKKDLYKGIIVECRSNSSLQGAQYYQFERINKNQFNTKVTSNVTHLTFYIRSEFRNDSVMTAGHYNKWKKLRDYHAPILPHLTTSSDTASGRWVDSSNFLITIPTSTFYNGQIVESIIKTVPAITTRLPHLIIDIRGNMGGTVRAFNSLLPLLYTNPIIKVNVSEYCTQHTIGDTKEWLNQHTSAKDVDSIDLADMREWLQKEQGNLGKFISMPQDTFKYDSVLPYPKQISIIANYKCLSASEMFLLDAKQSKKVTLFGEHTMGAVDYLDVYSCSFPSGRYTLYMPTTKRIIPEGGKKLDGIGIQPDVKIGDSETDWVDFVKRYYEEH